MPLVSVITVVYNGIATIERTIQSVLSQTYADIEYVIVDGGSSDGTVDLIRKYESQIPNWVSEKDNGIYDAMNKGIKRAKGDWVFFLGADDLFHNAEVMKAVFGNADTERLDFFYGNVLSASYKGVYDGAFDLDKLLKKNISHQAIFYRKSLFDKIGNFNGRYRTHADWDMNIRCFLDNSLGIQYVDLVIAEFGAGGASSSHDVLFLKEVLFKEKLRRLQQVGAGTIRNLQVYDEWWRLLRNAQIRSVDEAVNDAAGAPIPPVIASMLAWQRKFSFAMLHKGPVSKSLMFLHYLLNRVRGRI
jgi:glycosyltransferase involved in cell wall biosynthesis